MAAPSQNTVLGLYGYDVHMKICIWYILVNNMLVKSSPHTIRTSSRTQNAKHPKLSELMNAAFDVRYDMFYVCLYPEAHGHY